MSLRASVALIGAGVLGVGLLVGNYTLVAVVLVVYVVWMYVRIPFERRDRERGWTRID